MKNILYYKFLFLQIFGFALGNVMLIIILVVDKMEDFTECISCQGNESFKLSFCRVENNWKYFFKNWQEWFSILWIWKFLKKTLLFRQGVQILFIISVILLIQLKPLLWVLTFGFSLWFFTVTSWNIHRASKGLSKNKTKQKKTNWNVEISLSQQLELFEHNAHPSQILTQCSIVTTDCYVDDG